MTQEELLNLAPDLKFITKTETEEEDNTPLSIAPDLANMGVKVQKPSSSSLTDLAPDLRNIPGFEGLPLPTEEKVPELKSVVSFDENGKPVVSATGYTANDLVKDEFYKPIESYMRSRFGSQVLEDGREATVDKFLNNMRGFAGGNTVRAGAEIAYLNSQETDKEREDTAAAYAIYENMEGLFSGENTWEETIFGVGDFVRSGLLDPVNLVSFGVGKLATSGGTRLATQAAQHAARKAGAEAAKRTGTAAAKEAARKKVATETFRAVTKQEAQREAAGVAQRNAIRESAAATVKSRLMNSTVAKEIVATGVVDGVAAAATDYMYQNALIRTKVQDEYSVVQTGVAALGSIVVMGGIQAGANFLTKGRGAAVGPDLPKKNPKQDKVELSDLTSNIEKALKKAPKKTKYERKRIEAKDLTSDFYIKMILGDDTQGVKGLVHTLQEQGFVFDRSADPDYTITRFMSDVLKATDPSEFRTFIKTVADSSGVEIKGLNKIGQKKFAELFTEKMSFAGEMMQGASTVAKLIGVDPKKLTVEDYLHFQLTGQLPKRGMTQSEKWAVQGSGLLRWVGAPVPEGAISATQNRLIRMLVTNPSTTALNVTGYAAASTVNSAVDLLLAGAQGMKTAVDTRSAKEGLKVLRNYAANQKFKLQNTLDPNMSADMFRKYAAARPQAIAELGRVIPGGVEDINRLANEVDLKQTFVGEMADKGIDRLQSLMLVSAQDTYTKAIEFTTQMDKNLREAFGMGYEEFFKRPQEEYLKDMTDIKYRVAEFKAADDTLSAIFSKSYKGTDAIGEVAGIIEDARNIPVVGMMMPFGRFFNNTMAFMADHTFISLAGRVVGANRRNSTTPTKELVARTAVGLGTIFTLVGREGSFIDKGYSWSQEDDSVTNSGGVIDEKYEYPYAFFKAAARIIAHMIRGESPPEEMVSDMIATFGGQLTRNLQDAGTGVEGLIMAGLTGEDGAIFDHLASMATNVGAQMVNAGTRFLEPFNLAAGLAKGDDYFLVDQKQGNADARKSIRYIDQIIGNYDEEDERFSPTQGRVRSQATKSLSTVREADMTDLERLYNMVGVPSWKAGLRTDFPELKNRYAEVFYELNEAGAARLLQDPDFREGSLKKKRFLFDQMEKEAARAAKDFIGYSQSSGDLKLSLVQEIDNNSSQEEVDEAMKSLELEGNVEELSSNQLYILLEYLKGFDDIEEYKYTVDE